MFYDLHIHSSLSPCASDENTLNNILNMASIKGLNLISICDHNSMLQYESLNKIQHEVKFLYGCEVCSVEEVHLLGYFKEYQQVIIFQQYLEDNLIKINNNVEFFGHQLILNELDEVKGEYPYLLLMAINKSIDDVIAKVHELKGKIVLAHVLKDKNSITSQLGFIPENLAIDGIEISNLSQKDQLLKSYPFLKDKQFFINSDAHQLIDISEAVNEISENDFERFME